MNQVELTLREQDILKLLCKGYSDRAIAEQLVLSLGTVKWYDKQIFSKLGVTNRVQATIAAHTLGLMSPTPDLSQPHLPLALTSFIGRTDNIREVCQLLDQHRLVTIVGPGGMGKTRLAIEAAQHFRAGQRFTPCFVPLAAYSQADAVPLAIADRLGIRVRNQQPVQRVIEQLLRQPTLLILDNFEELIAVSSLLSTILQSVAEVRLLVTSRERLHMYGETIYPLAGLAVPPAVEAKSFTSDATVLFVERAQQANATFKPTDDQQMQIAAICRLLQGIPLAIEQAASWMYMLDLKTILEEIQRGINILISDMHGIETRHHSMRAVVDRSWERLTPHERNALVRLAVFHGGFSRDAAAQTAEADLPTLIGLVAKSFVTRTGADRYSLHEIYRQYAIEKLAESGMTADAHRQHARYFQELIGRIAPQRWTMDEAQIEALDRLDEEYLNLREAIQWSFQVDNGYTALDILGSGGIFFHDRGHNAESIVWTREALNHCPNAPIEVYVRAYFALALQDDHATDEEHEIYMRRALSSEDAELLAVAYWQNGDHAAFKGDYEVAQQYYEQALAFCPHTEYVHLASIVLNYMGRLAEKRGHVEPAIQYYREAWAQGKKLGSRSVARPLYLGRVLLREDESQALELFRVALENAIFLASPLWTYEALYTIAVYLQDKHGLMDAIQILSACDALAARLNLSLAAAKSRRDDWRKNMPMPIFDVQWKAGQSLSLAEAIALAQQALDKIGASTHRIG